MTGVLHHLEDDVVERILREMRRVLRPGGRALVMEDTAVGFKLNLLGALVHLADEGSFIRRDDQYAALFQRHFQIRAHYRIRSGVCDYEVFVLEPWMKRVVLIASIHRLLSNIDPDTRLYVRDISSWRPGWWLILRVRHWRATSRTWKRLSGIAFNEQFQR